MLDDPRFAAISAIFCANDQMALGVLAAPARRAVAVPTAINVIGMDDIAEAEFMFPSLSTVPMNFDVQGHFAFESLLARIEGREMEAKTDCLHTEVIRRASTGALQS